MAHRGPRARLEGAKIIREKAESLGKGCSILITGDFNSAEGSEALATLLSGGKVDAITFTSSSTVRYTVEGIVAGGLDRTRAVELLNRTAIVCIGPVTAATATELGLRVSAVADEYTTGGLVQALVSLFAGGEPVASAS